MAERVIEAVMWFLLIVFGASLLAILLGFYGFTERYPPVWWWVNLVSTTLVLLGIDRTPGFLRERKLEWIWGVLLLAAVIAGMGYPLIRYGL